MGSVWCRAQNIGKRATLSPRRPRFSRPPRHGAHAVTWPWWRRGGRTGREAGRAAARPARKKKTSKQNGVEETARVRAPRPARPASTGRRSPPRPSLTCRQRARVGQAQQYFAQHFGGQVQQVADAAAGGGGQRDGLHAGGEGGGCFHVWGGGVEEGGGRGVFCFGSTLAPAPCTFFPSICLPVYPPCGGWSQPPRGGVPLPISPSARTSVSFLHSSQAPHATRRDNDDSRAPHPGLPARPDSVERRRGRRGQHVHDTAG